jgi:hypothetical protein
MSTHLRATCHTDSLDMIVLQSTGASRYHNCCIDGGTIPEYFGYTLEWALWFSAISNLEHEDFRCCETSGSNHPVLQCHIPQEPNYQILCNSIPVTDQIVISLPIQISCCQFTQLHYTDHRASCWTTTGQTPLSNILTVRFPAGSFSPSRKMSV